MAFSTQKDFLHVAFMNERPEQQCLRLEGVNLRTYSSTADERAWSMSRDKQAQYLIDLVACRTYPHSGEGGDGVSPSGSRRARSATNCRSPRATSECSQRTPRDQNSEGATQRSPQDDADYPLVAGVGDDSLIHAALEEMTKLEEILAEKDDLKSQLELSQEKIRVLKEEKDTIDAILNDEHYPEMSCQLEQAINCLKSSSKIDKNDENELLKILDALQNREKAYKVLDAENSYLRRLVEKLSLRCEIHSITMEPETCTDVNWLQNEVNTLRKEVCLLRCREDKQLKKEVVSRGIQGPCNDIENLAKIIAERNALRDKCQNLAAIEDKICQWKHDAEQMQCIRKEACAALKKKDDELQDCREEIEELQYELKKMDKCVKMSNQEGENLCTTMDCLKEENRRMRDEINRSKCDLKKISMLQNQIQCLTNELCEKNCVIDQYDIQFQQILGVVENLQKKDSTVDIRGLQDVDSQTHMDLLADSTRITLDQISRELECRNSLEAELGVNRTELEMARREGQAKESENLQLRATIQKTTTAVKQSFDELELEAQPGEDCAAQVERLKCLIIDMKCEQESLRRKSTELESASTSVLDEKYKLQNENYELNKALKECQNKVRSLQDQINQLGGKTDDLECELRCSQANLQEVGKLVKQISSVQDRNENLQSVLGAVDYSDQPKKAKFEEEAAAGKPEKAEKAEKAGAVADKAEKAGDVGGKAAKADAAPKEAGKASPAEDKAKTGAAEEKTAKADTGGAEAAKAGPASVVAAEVSKAGAGAGEAAKAIADEVSAGPVVAAEPVAAAVDAGEAGAGAGEAGATADEAGAAEGGAAAEAGEAGAGEAGAGAGEASTKAGKTGAKADKAPAAAAGEVGAAAGKATDKARKAPGAKAAPASEGAGLEKGGADTKADVVPKGGKSDLAKSGGPEADSKAISATSPSDGAAPKGKLAQLQKIHEAQRTADRKDYEKELEGHRLSNEILTASITKLTTKINTGSASEFEKEFRNILDNFVEEICKWRCERVCNKKLTKLQEIAKKILEIGIDCLTYKELVYLHQQMSAAALKLRPRSSRNLKRDITCCKCSGDICCVPIIPRENEQILLDKLAILERDIQSARENLRRIKQEQDQSSIDTEDMELETMRANTYRLNRGIKNCSARSRSSRFHYAIQEEFEVPTKDRCGF